MQSGGGCSSRNRESTRPRTRHRRFERYPRARARRRTGGRMRPDGALPSGRKDRTDGGVAGMARPRSRTPGAGLPGRGGARGERWAYYLHAQVAVEGFYLKCGFRPIGGGVRGGRDSPSPDGTRALKVNRRLPVSPQFADKLINHRGQRGGPLDWHVMMRVIDHFQAHQRVGLQRRPAASAVMIRDRPPRTSNNGTRTCADRFEHVNPVAADKAVAIELESVTAARRPA